MTEALLTYNYLWRDDEITQYINQIPLTLSIRGIFDGYIRRRTRFPSVDWICIIVMFLGSNTLVWEVPFQNTP